MHPLSQLLPKLLLPAIFVLSACTHSDPAAPQGDWIELPLEPGIFSESAADFRSETFEIPLLPYQALEFHVSIAEGDTVVYSWDVDMAEPELLAVEYHGHTERAPDDPPGLLMFYKIHNDGQERGSLTAPFTGSHGWFLDNQSDQDIVVRLHLAGFYQTH